MAREIPSTSLSAGSTLRLKCGSAQNDLHLAIDLAERHWLAAVSVEMSPGV